MLQSTWYIPFLSPNSSPPPTPISLARLNRTAVYKQDGSTYLTTPTEKVTEVHWTRDEEKKQVLPTSKCTHKQGEYHINWYKCRYKRKETDTYRYKRRQHLGIQRISENLSQQCTCLCQKPCNKTAETAAMVLTPAWLSCSHQLTSFSSSSMICSLKE